MCFTVVSTQIERWCVGEDKCILIILQSYQDDMLTGVQAALNAERAML